MLNKAIKIIFRQTPENKFTIPLLFNILESDHIDKQFSIEVASSRSQLKKACASASRAIIAYSFMTPQLPEIWKEILDIRELFQDRIFLIAGGPHASGASDETLRVGFDTVISGAAEPVFSQTIRKIIENPDEVRGRVIHGNSVSHLDDFLPVSRTIPFVPPLEIMRGCNYRCGFCQTGHQQKPVYRSLNSVKNYMDKLIHRNLLLRSGFICPSGLEYGATKSGQPNLENIECLLDMAKSIGIRYLEYGIFPSEIHPKTVSPEAFQLIRKYCSNKKITLGAQSGSNDILKKLKRGHTIEDIEAATALASDHGFRTILDFIIGFPGETEEDRLVTLKWIKHLHTQYRARIQMHYFLPLAGTRLADQKPSLLNQKSRALLDTYHKGGICTDWWRTGFDKSWELVKMKEELDKNGNIISNQ